MSGDGPVDDPNAEVLGDEPRNLLLALASQVRIGMDLSRISLPTFILEPRSMLEKLTDFMAHPEQALLASTIQDPMQRMVEAVRWYMSGFYIRPKGVKKPYNPLLGEYYRCHWDHVDPVPTTTWYYAEQVSHHPPQSCFFASNRRAGIVCNGNMFPRSRFLGNSSAAYLDGQATIWLLEHNETYTFTFPSAFARGILFGTLLMELCGVVTIKCEQSGLSAELDFKAKPFFGGGYNKVEGSIKDAKGKTAFKVWGHWDQIIYIKGAKDKNEEVLFDPKGRRPWPKHVTPAELQGAFESHRLWASVSAAIRKNDQDAAGAAKGALEESQRNEAREREESGVEYEPRLFRKNEAGGYDYKFINLTRYDPATEGEEIEMDGIVVTLKKDEAKPTNIDELNAILKARNLPIPRPIR